MFSLSPEEWVAIGLSLRIASVATLLSLPLAVATALLLARGRFPGRSLIDGVVHLPLILPPVVTGFALLLLFGPRGLLGSTVYYALAAGVMAFPLMVRAIRLSIEAIDPRLETAAGTLGANRFWTFLLVTLPLAAPGILVGAILAFAKALGEFGATITFVSNIPGETQTISAAIYSLTQTPGGDLAALRLAIVAGAIALAALVISELLQRRAVARVSGLA